MNLERKIRVIHSTVPRMEHIMRHTEELDCFEKAYNSRDKGPAKEDVDYPHFCIAKIKLMGSQATQEKSKQSCSVSTLRIIGRCWCNSDATFRTDLSLGVDRLSTFRAKLSGLSCQRIFPPIYAYN